jgi:myo-inositol catabolism protein IolS
MKYRTLGQIKKKVSEIGIGCWAIGGDSANTQYADFASYGPSDDHTSRAMLYRALESGVTLFDTADVFGHGHSEALIGEVLETWSDRDNVTVVTKGGINFYRRGEIPEHDFTPYAIANAVQHSRARLRREKLDIYLLMSPPPSLLIEKEYVWKSLESLQSAGHIGDFGVSAGSTEDAVEILRSDFPLDVIEVPLSLYDQSAIVELLPLAIKRGVSVLAREPLANGFLSGKYGSKTFEETDMRGGLPVEYRDAMIEMGDKLAGVLVGSDRTLAQAAIRFVLDELGVTSVVVGARTPEQVEENIKASGMSQLSDDEREKISKVFFPE